MLKELSIHNFAIIDDLRIQFEDGLTIMSGETGAGKSIILNAVNLLLGSRASADLVRSGTETAELEALFEISSASKTATTMRDHGYDVDEGLLIRRLISPKNGNRVYINNRLATIQSLITITENLASISGQHAHQGLLKPEKHLTILDQFAGLIPLRDKVGRQYRQILELIKTHDDLTRSQKRQVEQTELLRFQLNEIDSAGLQTGEDEQLEAERLRLKNAEALYGSVYNAVATLYSEEGAVNEQVGEVRRRLQKSAEIDPALKSAAESLADMGYRIDDLASELQGYLNTVHIDQKRLESVEERLDTLTRLKRKYGDTLEAVIQKGDQIKATLSGVESIADRIEAIEVKLTDTKAKMAKMALKLSAERNRAAKRLARKVEKELATLKMDGTAFEVRIEAVTADDRSDARLVVDKKLLTESGWDLSEFRISPNVGEELKPLATVASGGELSRVVLALKCILAASDAVETLVFDEVDAGIGGGTAEVVGRKLTELSQFHQILCITHLPQIAKFAREHLLIAKDVSRGRTRTGIQRLDDSSRQKEIARMLGGEKITAATLEHARELLEE